MYVSSSLKPLSFPDNSHNKIKVSKEQAYFFVVCIANNKFDKPSHFEIQIYLDILMGG